MNIRIDTVKYDMFQIFWWWRIPAFKIWTYPMKYDCRLFKGFYFGVFEIRLFYRMTRTKDGTK